MPGETIPCDGLPKQHLAVIEKLRIGRQLALEALSHRRIHLAAPQDEGETDNALFASPELEGATGQDATYSAGKLFAAAAKQDRKPRMSAFAKMDLLKQVRD